MSHELESMFYVTEVPWHGLGIKLDNPPTIKEAIIKAGLDWTVSTHRLYYEHPTLDGYQVTPNCGVIRDTDGATPAGACQARHRCLGESVACAAP